MNKRPKASRLNVRLALSIWGDVSQAALLNLKELTRRYALSVAAGDLQFFANRSTSALFWDENGIARRTL